MEKVTHGEEKYTIEEKKKYAKHAKRLQTKAYTNKKHAHLLMIGIRTSY